MGNIFVSMLISTGIFGGMADIPDIFWVWLIYHISFLVKTRCWDPAYVADNIQGTPTPWAWNGQ